MEEFVREVMEIVAPALTTVVGLLVAWGLAELRKFLKTKTDNETVTQAFDQLSNVVQTTVVSLNQTFSRALADGKLSDPEKAEIKKMAVERVKSQIPKVTKKVLVRAITDLERHIDDQIETAVNYDKRG